MKVSPIGAGQINVERKQALLTAVHAAQASGRLMRANWHKPKRIGSSVQHDIKLELDVRCQKTIERVLRREFPAIPILGEEESVGGTQPEWRWVVDPIDGTVNYAYGIPHACVSIALQKRVGTGGGGFETQVGVVSDPFCNELWTATKGGKARLNGKVIHVSERHRMNEAIVSLGFAKSRETLEIMLPVFHDLVHRVRKIRIMGAAALAMVYVATGRFEGYIEHGLRLWDIAAGGLILECAGGSFHRQPVSGEHTYEIVASNKHLHKQLRLASKP